jgi:hypothetical protein
MLIQFKCLSLCPTDSRPDFSDPSKNVRIFYESCQAYCSSLYGSLSDNQQNYLLSDRSRINMSDFADCYSDFKDPSFDYATCFSNLFIKYKFIKDSSTYHIPMFYPKYQYSLGLECLDNLAELNISYRTGGSNISVYSGIITKYGQEYPTAFIGKILPSSVNSLDTTYPLNVNLLDVAGVSLSLVLDNNVTLSENKVRCGTNFGGY